MSEAVFYVYAILVDGVVKYIGKGCGDRAASHMRTARRVAQGSPPKVVQRVHRELALRLDRAIQVIRLHENKTESAAFELERDEIARRSDLWNLTDGGEGMAGFRPSPATIEKRRLSMAEPEVRRRLASMKGRTHDEKARARIREAVRLRWSDPNSREAAAIRSTGRRHSPETKAKIKIARARQVVSAEAIARMSAARGGNSEATRAKLRAAMLGHAVSREAREKIAAAQRGRKHSAEHRAKNAAAQRGRVHGPETREKMSASMKAAWAARRAAKKGRVYSPEERLIKYASRRKHPPKQEGASS